MQCIQSNFLLTSQVYPMLVSTEKVPFLIDGYIFSEGRCFHVLAWYCLHRVALLCDKF